MLLSAVNIVLFLLSLVLLIPALFFAIEVLLGLAPKAQPRQVEGAQDQTKLKVLIPAHNEELVIQTTLESLFDASISPDQILVIADNCSDSTADIVKNTGVPVVERQNDSLRGKGHALAFGIEELKSDPPDYVLIMDADCTIEPDTPEGLVKLSQGQHVVQPNYLIKAQDGADLSRRLSGFLFKIKNLIRSQALLNFGCSVPLLGSGMLFPWAIISSTKFATSNIVEDTKIGLDLQLSGTKILFAPQFNVFSYFPDTDAARESQSVRWEQGNLQIALEYVPKLTVAAIKKRDYRLALSALHILVPPVSLLILGILGLSVLSLIPYLAKGLSATLALNFVSLAAISFSILICWLSCGRSDIAVTELFIDLPIKTVKKIPHYFRILKFRNLEWVKTDREQSSK